MSILSDLVDVLPKASRFETRVEHRRSTLVGGEYAGSSKSAQAYPPGAYQLNSGYSSHRYGIVHGIIDFLHEICHNFVAELNQNI